MATWEEKGLSTPKPGMKAARPCAVVLRTLPTRRLLASEGGMLGA
jgi:hypothetical protein